MARILSKDTRLCMSLSGRPGNFGTRFHNALYDLLELDYVRELLQNNQILQALMAAPLWKYFYGEKEL